MSNGPRLSHTSARYFSRDGPHRIFFFRCTCMHVNCEVIIMHRSSYSARERERSWSLAIDGAHRSPYACSLIICRRAYSFCSVMALSLCLFRYEVVRHRTSSPFICPILLGVLGLIIILNNTEAHFAVSRDHYTDRCMHRDVYMYTYLLLLILHAKATYIAVWSLPHGFSNGTWASSKLKNMKKKKEKRLQQAVLEHRTREKDASRNVQDYLLSSC